MRRWHHILLGIFAAISATALFGFVLFANITTRVSKPVVLQSDAIVALTGGAHRIRVAGGLLKAGLARRLLITGVNRVVSRSELRKLLDIDQSLFECCVDVDFAAQNTRGNAIETRKWAIKHKFASLIVVTSSYHMPRSLAELSHLLPAVDLIAYPIVPDRFQLSPWWLDRESLALLGAEYLKYLPSVAQLGLGRMIDTPDADDKANSSIQKAVAIQ